MIRIRICKKLNMAGGVSNLVVNADLPLQKISALYGKSGAGKTSLLKIIAGLMLPEEGYIEVNGEVWLDTVKRINLPPQQRNIGFVFQDYALFPNMTLRQNLKYAAGKNADENLINYLLNLTRLEPFADHKPFTLSGGQQQRGALARALVRKPALLLLDEPLAAIDTATRVELQQELLALHQEYKFSALLVSHDAGEVYNLAEHLLCIDNGHITQSGIPAEVLGIDNPDGQITLFGQVVAVNDKVMQLLINQKRYALQYTKGVGVGDMVSVSFDLKDGKMNPILTSSV